MMRTMRDNTKWIMLITMLAFAALMVFEWGMDITGRTAGLSELGEVDGVPVLYDQYQFAYRNLYERTQLAQEEAITSDQNLEIEDAAFDEVVTQILIRRELERRGIRVSDDEIRQAARFSPPPQFQGLEGFQTDGVFDMQKYQDYLATASELALVELEAYYRDIIPRTKLMRQLSTGIYLPDAALWSAYKDENEQVEIRYLSLDPATRIGDDEVEVTDAEVAAYYRENRDDFAVPPRATVVAVVLDKDPTAADTAAARERAEEIRQEILDGADFAELAGEESADEGSAALGGTLGTFARGVMVPEFDSAAFSTPLETVTEPVGTQFGWHLIEVTSRTADSVSARHILVPVERTDASEIDLLTTADSLEVLGENLTLGEAAGELGLEATPVDITEDFPFVLGAGQVREGSEWAFEEAEEGDVSPVFENAEAFYALELVGREPEEVLPLEQARSSIEQTLRLEKKIERALAQAEGAAEGGGTLEQIAARLEADIEESPPFSRSDFVPGLGRQNTVIGTAFGLEAGQLSGVVEANGRAFVIELTERIPADSTAWEEQKVIQRAMIGGTLGQQRLDQWITSLRERARIVDRRREVFRAQEEAANQTQLPLAF
ncbi:MAG: peptidyl-prolyl cis-trans isomerase [Gammaproteobacteria bacterium]|nr:peptidyl-prolyl cis-trans isomerase [Gammaproteobacteria bacterium]